MTMLGPERPLPAAVERHWTTICRLADLLPERGACALVGDRQVAVFRAHSDEVYAVSNYDPFSGAFLLSRGIMGSRGDTPTVASPIGKQVFDLTAGICLDDPQVRIAVIDVRVSGGMVELAVPHAADGTAVR